MKTNILFAILGTIVSVSPAWAANTCLRTRDIVSTASKDSKTLVFKMRDGRTLVNHLQGDLTDILYHRHRETIASRPPDPEVVGQG